MSCTLFLLNGQVTAAEVEAAEALSPLSPGKCPPVSSLPSFPVFVVLSAASSIVKLLPSDGFLLLTTTTATTTWTASLSIILPFTVSVCFSLQSGAFIDGFLVVVVVVVMVMATFSILHSLSIGSTLLVIVISPAGPLRAVCAALAAPAAPTALQMS